MTVHYITHTDDYFTACDIYDLEATLDAENLATCDVEDVTNHPVISAQLARLRHEDSNGFEIMTDHLFTASELQNCIDNLEKE